MHEWYCAEVSLAGDVRILSSGVRITVFYCTYIGNIQQRFGDY